jgi:hypothetical protein
MSVAAALRARIPDRWVKRWPTIRAVLVTYHVVAVALLAVPAPYGVMSQELWQERNVQDEFRGWTGHLERIGVRVTPERLQEVLWGAAQDYLKAREVVITPFVPYQRVAGVEQSWRMFGAPNMYPVRLDVLIKEGGRWRRVYVTRSDEFTWMRRWFDDHAFRRIVFKGGWARNKPKYQAFCDWLAIRAARDFPEATDLTVRQYRYRLTTPAEMRAGKKESEGRYEAREDRPLRGGAARP